MKKYIEKIKNFVLGIDDKGLKCWVFVRQVNIVDFLKGHIGHAKDSILRIDYTWIDGSKQSFLCRENDVLGLKEGVPVFQHNFSKLFNAVEDGPISSEEYQKITNNNLIGQGLSYLENYEKGGSLPWKKILIIGGIVILVIVLWQNGVLTELLGDVIPSPRG